MALVQITLAFVLTLALLVTVHEYGHFWVARRCGVKVLRFSVGFGKPLFSWHDSQGTEYVIAWIPLGGYIKMLDEREGPVPVEERSRAFNRKHPVIRMLVVLAGPVANLLLAFFVLWVMYLVGLRAPVPVVGSVVPDSAAYDAGVMPGQEIVAVNERSAGDWRAVNEALLAEAVHSDAIRLSVREQGSPASEAETRLVRLDDWKAAGAQATSIITGLGIVPWQPEVEAVIGRVLPGEAAERADLREGDRIHSVNDQPVADWGHWVAMLRASPGETLALDVTRNDEHVTVYLTPSAKKQGGGPDVGYIGAAPVAVPWPADKLRTVRKGPLAALSVSAEKTLWLSTTVVTSLAKMLTGVTSLDQLSGPIGIARAAGASMAGGLTNFLGFLAMLSVSLGIINLLPVPTLDGGHFLFHLAELVRGKPLPENVQDFSVRVGLILILGMMCTALVNDFSRM